MKKFRFSLETVLDYKQQALDALLGEHGALREQVTRQEKTLAQAEDNYQSQNQLFRQREREGMTITEAMIFEASLRGMEATIQRESDLLVQIRQKELAKREEVVEAKKETSSLEKLREKKLDIHHKAEQKSEEAFVEEFVSTAMAMRGA